MFDTIIDNSQNIDYNMVCFCFGCLDLDFLLNDKHYLQSDKITEVYNHSISEKTKSFNNYYKLSEEEKKIILY